MRSVVSQTEFHNSAVSELTSNLLLGAEVAVTGRFASMSQTAVAELIRDCGGRLSRTLTLRTRFLVVGQGGLPLEQDGGPTPLLETARRFIANGCNLEILSEEYFLDRLGRHREAEGIQRRYSVIQLARILKLPAERIRSWLRQGLIEPAEMVNRIALFDFHQVAAVRTLCELTESGLAPGEIRKGLLQLRRLLPESASPLMQVSALESKSQMLVRLDNGLLAETTGQLRLDFEQEATESQPLSFVAVARSADDLFDDAVALEISGQWEAAVDTYRKGLELDPSDPVFHFNLGNVLYRLGHVDAAANEFHAALKADPGYVEAWNNFGSMLFESGRIDEAIAAFQRALSLVPTYSDACYNLASVLDHQGRTIEASRYWQMLG